MVALDVLAASDATNWTIRTCEMRIEIGRHMCLYMYIDIYLYVLRRAAPDGREALDLRA